LTALASFLLALSLLRILGNASRLRLALAVLTGLVTHS
jgi:hypothetical protein